MGSQGLKLYIVHKKLFAAANTLLNQRKKDTVLPPCDDKLELADRMGSYFVKKITDIGTRLDVMAQDLSTDPLLNCTGCKKLTSRDRYLTHSI